MGEVNIEAIKIAIEHLKKRAEVWDKLTDDEKLWISANHGELLSFDEANSLIPKPDFDRPKNANGNFLNSWAFNSAMGVRVIFPF